MDVHVSLVGRDDLAREVYRQLRAAILDGRLRPNDRLPPTREMARRLSVSRTTVTVAYDRLAAEGFVRAQVGAGTFVRDLAGRSAPPAASPGAPGALRPRAIWNAVTVPTPFDPPVRYDFRSGIPDGTLFPHVAWRRLVSRELRPRALGRCVYGSPAGEEPLRRAIARHVGVSRGVQADADDVTITNGTQGAMDILARVLVAPGEVVAVEDPGYPPVRLAFAMHGARVIGIPVDAAGLDVRTLQDDARVVCTTPSHHYPLGMTMTLARRIALLDWAERTGAAIIEDDYDSEFRFGGRPIEPLCTLDRSGRVVYVGTFSKTMLPGLRLGFMITPPSLRDAVRSARFVTDWHASPAPQRALARFIETGAFARHLRRMNRIYEDRHARILDSLARDFADVLEAVPSAAGLHISALARDASAADMAAVIGRALAADVAVQPLARFGVTGDGPPGLILGFGAVATTDIEEGLRRLRTAFDPPPRGHDTRRRDVVASVR